MQLLDRRLLQGLLDKNLELQADWRNKDIGDLLIGILTIQEDLLSELRSAAAMQERGEE